MEVEAIEALRKRFSKNPAAHIAEENRKFLRSKKAREQYVDISHAQAEELTEPTNFYRLFTMGDSAYTIAREGNGELIKLPDYAQRFDHIRNHIAKKNLGLVYTMLSHTNIQGCDKEELEEASFSALIRAIDKFNPWKGCKFSTYACFSINKAIERSKKNQHRYKTRFKNIADPFKEVIVEINEPAPSSDDEGAFRKNLRKVLETTDLTGLEAEVISARFFKEEKETLQSIGDRMGLSKERVRQIQNKALRNLRTKLELLV